MEQRIVIFGASGRTGRSVVAQAVQRGDEVVVLVRDASKQWFPDAVRCDRGTRRTRTTWRRRSWVPMR